MSDSFVSVDEIPEPDKYVIDAVASAVGFWIHVISINFTAKDEGIVMTILRALSPGGCKKK